MKQSKKTIAQRRKNILLMVKDKKYITVEDLAQNTGVSLPTLRRDLTYLDKKGLLKRKHGGASAIDSKVVTESMIEKKKELIAKTAASLVENDDIIFINSSTTSIKTIAYIEPSKYISVITNNGKAIDLHTLPNIKLILTGGETRQPKAAMTGEFALKNIQNVQANKAILGASGFHIKEGITTANIDEVAINKAMIEASKEVILCVDSSKLNHISAFISGISSDIDTLITDCDADKNFIKSLELMGIRCIQVDIRDYYGI
ncbi:MAG: DeoR/GlpR family DNA-binding transcription regulator [Tissierellia bacterium]|nr:DeoR/GlpR family DNA-binding transcription regulator [Tissierellia bacterium]